METINKFLDRLHQWTIRNPHGAVLVTNSATALYFLYLLAQRNGGVKKSLISLVMGAVKAIPGASGAIEAEQAKVVGQMEALVLKGEDPSMVPITALPSTGLPGEEIMTMLSDWSGKDMAKWKDGMVSGCVYHGGEELSRIATQVYGFYALSNPLHPDVFPSVRKMEAEVVAMTVKLFSGGADACGATTSGGTESILMACKAYRDYAKDVRGVTSPNMVIPTTAHAAFDKACHYFGIELVHVPVDPVTFRADVAAMAKAINSNTIMLVGSAPCFPQGVVDPIEDLAALAKERSLPLHVDCCLGSFLIPYAKKLGYPIPNFDFAVDGVTSISADTHKYGFAPKGSSVILYSHPKWRKYQYFVATDWTGGVYASPTIAGSRAGALVAATWATLVHVGDAGYRDAAKVIMDAAKKVADGIRALGTEDICLYGEPDLSVVAFGPSPGSKINIFNVGDALSARGWNLNTLQHPGSIHVCVTYANAPRVASLVDDLRDAIEEVKTAPPGKFKDGMGAIYGMAESIPDRSMVGDLARAFLDVLYKTK